MEVEELGYKPAHRWVAGVIGTVLVLKKSFSLVCLFGKHRTGTTAMVRAGLGPKPGAGDPIQIC